jgi:fused signal recognition particle receptor
MNDTRDKNGWRSRLRARLERSSTLLSEGIGNVFAKHKLDDDTLAELEDVLIAADLGLPTAAKLVADFSRHRFGANISDHDVKMALAGQVTALLQPYAVPLIIDGTKKPFVILVVGVNGTGKTTTIGKLAHQYREQGLNVILAAGDTFRAAAVSQLKIWGERTGARVIAGEPNGDSAALAFRAYEKARTEKTDILLIDTAGRLHTKIDLMQELAKIVRVLKKMDPSVPHATLLVLDATTGQNAHAQVEVFRDLTPVTGLVVTKLDGSAKGGVLVALADRFKLPIYAIGIGEGLTDLQAFDAADFAKALVDCE